MSRVCEVTGKRPIVGHKISHSNIKTKIRNYPNLQKVRALVDGRVQTIRVSTRALKSGLVVKAPRGLKKALQARS